MDLDAAYSETDCSIRTKVLVVVHRDRVVGEPEWAGTRSLEEEPALAQYEGGDGGHRLCEKAQGKVPHLFLVPEGLKSLDSIGVSSELPDALHNSGVKVLHGLAEISDAQSLCRREYRYPHALLTGEHTEPPRVANFLKGRRGIRF